MIEYLKKQIVFTPYGWLTGDALVSFLLSMKPKSEEELMNSYLICVQAGEGRVANE